MFKAIWMKVANILGMKDYLAGLYKHVDIMRFRI